MAIHEVEVGPLPPWLDARRLLGPTGAEDREGQGWELIAGREGVRASARLSSTRAADLSARLRGVGLDGMALACEVHPTLKRGLVRRARTEDARRRRNTTPGFSHTGARLDAVGRMSLTPERLAQRVAGWAEGAPVVDAGCGAGGNAIAFARAGCRVVAIERDLQRLADARHNAGLFGVAKAIEFRSGDALELARVAPERGAILFVDPPWGADWDRQRSELDDFPLLARLLAEARGYAALWAKLPPSFATTQLCAGRNAQVSALFGEAEGDFRRVKFVLVRCALEVAA